MFAGIPRQRQNAAIEAQELPPTDFTVMRIHQYSRACKGLLVAASMALSVPAVSADLANAMSAYKTGDFAKAREQFQALAGLGEGRAQFNLGAMALRGEGMAKDEGVAAGWLRASVQNGYKGMEENRLQLLEAGLSSVGQEAAAQILARYGRDALLTSVLPVRGPLRCKRQVTPPRTQQMAQPTYPPLALRDRQDGIVILQFTVGIDGLARDPEVLAAAPVEKFDRYAIRAVLQSRFQPATLDGAPIEARMQVRHTFMIRQGGDLWSVGAVQQAKESAAAGNPAAQYIVGLLGLLDPSLKIPQDQARDMVLASAQTGYPEAQYWVGIHVRNESYCNDSNKMRPWIEQAAQGQLASAKISLARQFLSQPDAASHLDRVSSLLRDAAQAKDAYSVKHAIALLTVPPHEALRDPATALTAAKNLDDMDVDYDPQVDEVIAAAYAANGDFARATKHQERALDTAEDLHWNDSAMRERLAAYKSSQSWSGDLLALPPATGPLPEVDNPNRGCGKGNEKCERKPDEKRSRTGSSISR
jgi:uncharacterized protein